MSKRPIVFTTNHRIRFSDLDPYAHVSTGNYARYFVDHRMEGFYDVLGWDQETLATLPFMAWVRRLEIDFIRPARDHQKITITSFVREFRGPDAVVDCTMVDDAGKSLAQCVMTIAYVDRTIGRAADWSPEAMAAFYEDGSG